MANTYVDYTAVASQTDYNFSFEYLRDEHVKVKVDDVIVTNYTIVTSPTPTKIRFDTAPDAGAEIRIYRDSRGDFSPLVDFVDGSVLTENELDEAYRHNLFVSQEASEGTGNELLNKKGLTHYDAEDNKIINLGTPDDRTDAANRGYVDDTIDTAIALGGSPSIVSLGGYDVTSANGNLKQLRAWTGNIEDSSYKVDDFASVQAALDHIVSNGGVLEFTKGKTYTISSPLTATLSATNQELRWEIVGNGATLDCSSLTGSQVALTVGGDSDSYLNEKGYYSIKGLRFKGPEAATPINESSNNTTTVGLFIKYAIRVNLESVECTKFYTGIKSAFVFPLISNNCSVENNFIGLHLDDASNVQKWNQLSAKQCWYSVLIIKSGDYSTAKISGINFEGLWTESSKVGVHVALQKTGTNDAPSWSSSDAYSEGDILKDPTDASKIYRAKQSVPANTPLTNTTYWYDLRNHIIRSLRFANGFYKGHEYDSFRFGIEWNFATPEARGGDEVGKIFDVEIEGGNFPGNPADADTGVFVFSPTPNVFGFFGHASIDIDDTNAWVNEPSMGEFLATTDEAVGTGTDFKKRYWDLANRQKPILISESIAEGYAEGDWTPTLSFQTPGDQVIAYSIRYGTYTRIGRLVTVHFDIETSTFTHSTSPDPADHASGAFRINNLPYRPRTISGVTYRPHGDLSSRGITGEEHVSCIAQAGSSAMTFLKDATNTVDESEVPSGGTVRLLGTIQYETEDTSAS